jgi:hypothetical protein
MSLEEIEAHLAKDFDPADYYLVECEKGNALGCYLYAQSQQHKNPEQELIYCKKACSLKHLEACRATAFILTAAERFEESLPYYDISCTNNLEDGCEMAQLIRDKLANRQNSTK